VGGKYPSLWHYQHLLDPRSTSPGSNMPSYAFMQADKVDVRALEGSLRAMKMLGVPYSDADVGRAAEDAHKEGQAIADDLAKQGATIDPSSELAALIAYLQILGRH
jgi:cytochrome c oxidase cbb3-type subunit I/II